MHLLVLDGDGVADGLHGFGGGHDVVVLLRHQRGHGDGGGVLGRRLLCQTEAGALQHGLVESVVAAFEAEDLGELFADAAALQRLEHDQRLDLGELLGVLGPGDGGGVGAQAH
ncbi:hypothetical protein [Streptomyces sp. NPDC058954]|uniref:hypothetical protein n=1 Tax=Streptomyces sp. NPDC058954 TaxID=3346677 RepID=UPI0036C74AA4